MHAERETARQPPEASGGRGTPGLPLTRAAEVLVTGASGFIGAALCRALSDAGYQVRRALRSLPASEADLHSRAFVVGDIGSHTNWAAALAGARYVVHLAARTHVMRETAADALAEYRRINVEGSRRLIEHAVAAGVQRFVFMSSIKVNGEATFGCPYTEADAPAPKDAYGISKWEAEQALAQAGDAGGIEIVILRPPLVYGPGVKGNFLRLLSMVARRLPLPFAALENRRSLIYVDNLAAAAIASLAAPYARWRTYLVSDGEDISTPGLVRALALALDARPRLFACPPSVLRTVATLAGKAEEFERLAGSLQVDTSRIANELGWRPHCTLAEGLAETARWYRCLFKR
ncbi:MAG TPA: SDR family oxidoreductase [Burkholderiales bacterium]|nr:SDR family oxidoreductase [Burkholderiales bacterium]